MIVAAHQPAFLPWLGYLDKMAKADLFVVMDDVQYEAQNFQNRNRIKRNDGAAWLTVPLHRSAQADPVLAKRICNDGNKKQHWQWRAWRTLEIHYRRARFWRDYEADLREVFVDRRWERLVDLDLHVLELARRWFGIARPIIRSSTLGLRGAKTDRIIDLCQKVKATSYLSGAGGSAGYLDVDRMTRSGLGVVWQSFEHPRYAQRYPDLGFLPNLAFIDLALNCGPEARDILLPRSHPLRAEVGR